MALAAVLIALNIAGLRDRLLTAVGASVSRRTVPVPKIESLAVLPLENLSHDPEQEYFAEGMTEALIAELGQIGSLRVISRTSVMHFKGARPEGGLQEIARKLNVDAVVEGSVMRSGDRVRITAQLIDAKADRHLWARSYERDLRDILSLQGEVARAIADQIKVTLTPEEKSRLASVRRVDPEAYQLYLKGNFQLTRLSEEAFRKAVEHYQQAIEKDPTWAPAYAGLSMAYQELGSWHTSLPDRAFHGESKEAVLKALELDDALPEAHIALGGLKFYEWDWAGADQAFRRGIELNPSATSARVGYANYLTAMGRFEESIAVGKRTLELDPLSPFAYNELGWALECAGRDEEALQLCQKGLELDPTFVQSHWILADLYLKKGTFDKAIEHLKKMEGFLDGTRPSPHLALLGFQYARAGRRDDALRILNELKRRAEREYVPAVALAHIYLGLGERQKAVDFMEKAYKDRNNLMVWLKVSWEYDPLRSDPRFQDLLRRMNFPQ